MASPSQIKAEAIILLVYGYTREIKLTLNIGVFNIPIELNELIIKYHPREYKILSIGRNLFGEFGLNNESESNDKYQLLNQFSNLCYNHNEIYCGFFTFTVRTQDNEFYSCGNNCDGQLGCNIRDYNIKEFNKISYSHNNINNNQPRLFSNGPFSWHRIFVTENNKFYGFGRNKNSTLGSSKYPEKNYQPMPLQNLTQVFMNFNVISIECGASHTLFLCDNGKLFSCGENDRGQCGNNNNLNIIQQPKEIENIPFIIKIAVGEYFSLAISINNNLWVFGSNKDYQLGIENKRNDDDDDDDDDINANIHIPTLNLYFKNNNIKIESIYCGESHSFIICNKYNVYCFGQNQHGESLGKFKLSEIKKYQPICFQFVINNYNINIIDGSCGNCHTMLLTQTNQIYGFGANDHGQVSFNIKKQKIHKPTLLTKEEIGIDKNNNIERVIAGCYTTLIICNKFP